ncbi:MAG: DUF1800 family protein, partial [bacterium]
MIDTMNLSASRQTVKTVALCIAVQVLGACTHAAPFVVPEPTLVSRNEPRELTPYQQARQAVDRLTYGARPGDVSAVLHEGLDHWLLRQLTPENWPDRGADSALAGRSVLTMTIRSLVDSSPPQDEFIRRRRHELGLADSAHFVPTPADSTRLKELTDVGNRLVNEFLGGKFARAVSSDHQLEEVMTDFWENHFSVFREKMPTRFTILEYDRDVIRP